MHSTSIVRPFLLVTRFLQWSSAVIVVGLTSFFINQGPRGGHIIYTEVIAVMSLVIFIPGFISPFMHTALSKFVLGVDIIFSYLWLISFVFAAQDYDNQLCFFRAPPGQSCSKKRANQAFIFLAFIFTFFNIFLEVAALFAYRREHDRAAVPVKEKNDGTRPPPLDGPVAAPAPVATTNNV